MWKSIVFTFLFLSATCFAHAYFTELPGSITPEQLLIDDEQEEFTEDRIVVTVDQLEDIIDELNRSKRPREKHVKIWFVNNLNSNPGNGSYKNPFNTLLAAQQASKKGDIIFVFPGDNTTKGMNQGFIMKNGQRLLGAGVHHKIDFPQTKLVVHAPSTTLPRITNTNGSVVILANSCEVSGMNIVDITNGDGILGGEANTTVSTSPGPRQPGIKDTLIQKNVIGSLKHDQNNVLDGAIYLANCRGKLIIENNYIYNILGANAEEEGNGIRISNANISVSSHVKIRKNIVSNTGAIFITLLHNSPKGKVKGLIERNVTFNNGQVRHGLNIGTDRIDAGGQLCVEIERNFCQNIHAGSNLLVTSTGTARVKAHVIDNILARSGLLDSGIVLSGFIGASFDNSTLCLELVKNFSEFGYELRQFGNSTFKLEPLHKNLGLPFITSGIIKRVRSGKCDCEKPHPHEESSSCHCCCAKGD